MFGPRLETQSSLIPKPPSLTWVMHILREPVLSLPQDQA